MLVQSTTNNADNLRALYKVRPQVVEVRHLSPVACRLSPVHRYRWILEVLIPWYESCMMYALSSTGEGAIFNQL